MLIIENFQNSHLKSHKVLDRDVRLSLISQAQMKDTVSLWLKGTQTGFSLSGSVFEIFRRFLLIISSQIFC